MRPSETQLHPPGVHPPIWNLVALLLMALSWLTAQAAWVMGTVLPLQMQVSRLNHLQEKYLRASDVAWPLSLERGRSLPADMTMEKASR